MNRSSCERVHIWAALAPDGTLSEIERRLLDAHVEQCAACRTFAADVVALTERLREAPLEPVRLPEFRAPRSRLQLRFSHVAASAAAVAAVVVGATVIGFAPNQRPSGPVVETGFVEPDSPMLRQLRDRANLRFVQRQARSQRGAPGVLEG